MMGTDDAPVNPQEAWARGRVRDDALMVEAARRLNTEHVPISTLDIKGALKTKANDHEKTGSTKVCWPS